MAIYDINGNRISTGGGGDGGLFREVAALPNGYRLPKFPTAYYDGANPAWRWTDYNNDLATAVGAGRYLFTGWLFSGTIYVRSISNSPYTGGTQKMVAVDAGFLDTLAGDGTELTPTFTRRNFDGDIVGVFADGSHEFAAAGAQGVDGAYGYVVLQRFDIPEGRFGALTTGITADNLTSSHYGWVSGWNAVFTIDPTDTITEIPTGDPLNAVEAVNAEGFAAGLVGNPYFARYFAEHAARFVPSWGKPHTHGKAVYLGGDSNHAYFGGNGSTEPGFVTDWNRHLGFATVANAGFAGSSWYDTSGGGGIKRVTELIANGKAYDIISLAWGTNDDAERYGTIDDEASNAEGCTMVAAMKWCITQLRTAFPQTAICVICPPPKFGTAGDAAADLMIEVCTMLHVPYVDMRRHISMDDMSSDGIHLGLGGQRKYGAAQAALLLECCPFGDPL